MPSLDGKYIYYTLRPGTQVWRVPVDGGDKQPVLPPLDNWGNFAVVEKGIYFIAANTKTIAFYDFATRATSPVYTLEKPASFGLTATPDGKTVLFTQTDRDSNELVLVENFH
jgi:hypothetical protein